MLLAVVILFLADRARALEENHTAVSLRKILLLKRKQHNVRHGIEILMPNPFGVVSISLPHLQGRPAGAE
jgi:hypothetical protein